jgi:MFS family permease
MALAQLALWLGLYGPLKSLLPVLGTQIAVQANGAGASKEALLAAVTMVGSLVVVMATPLAGSLSDRSRGPWGRRSPWIAGGSLVAGGGIALLPQAGSGGSLLILWGLANLGLGACLAALQGSAADRVPSGQQGSLWGWVGLAQPIGLVLGVGLCGLLVPNLGLAALVLAAVVVLAPAPFAVQEGRQAGLPEPEGARETPWHRQLSLAAFRHRPFACLWLSRFLLYLGWSISTVYLLYFLEDRQGLAQAQALDALTLLLGLYTGGTALASALTGPLANHLDRRLLLVGIGTGGMALACGLLLVSQSLPLALALAAAGLLGLAYGAYAASHQALVIQHLPSAQHHGRDLGLFHTANSAALVLAPALAWLLVTRLGGYGALFSAAVVLMLVSALPLLLLGAGSHPQLDPARTD